MLHYCSALRSLVKVMLLEGPVDSFLSRFAVFELQTLGHAPVLSLVLPRVLTVAAWVAAIGAVLDKREAEKKSAV